MTSHDSARSGRRLITHVDVSNAGNEMLLGWCGGLMRNSDGSAEVVDGSEGPQVVSDSEYNALSRGLLKLERPIEVESRSGLAVVGSDFRLILRLIERHAPDLHRQSCGRVVAGESDGGLWFSEFSRGEVAAIRKMIDSLCLELFDAEVASAGGTLMAPELLVSALLVSTSLDEVAVAVRACWLYEKIGKYKEAGRVRLDAALVLGCTESYFDRLVQDFDSEVSRRRSFGGAFQLSSTGQVRAAGSKASSTARLRRVDGGQDFSERTLITLHQKVALSIVGSLETENRRGAYAGPTAS